MIRISKVILTEIADLIVYFHLINRKDTYLEKKDRLDSLEILTRMIHNQSNGCLDFLSVTLPSG